MRFEEIPEYYRCEYEEDCTCCGLTIRICAAKYNYPEYETEVYVQCDCGEYIFFELPVN